MNGARGERYYATTIVVHLNATSLLLCIIFEKLPSPNSGKRNFSITLLKLKFLFYNSLKAEVFILIYLEFQQQIVHPQQDVVEYDSSNTCWAF